MTKIYPVMVSKIHGNLGKTGYWNGKPMRQEVKDKIRKSLTGRKLSEETKKKLVERKLGKPSPKIGRHYPHLQGENSHNWKGGKYAVNSISRANRRVREREAGGKHSSEQWEILKAQYNWTCPCCKESEPRIKLTKDHIIPVLKGGSSNIENIQPLCKRCNSRKKIQETRYEH